MGLSSDFNKTEGLVGEQGLFRSRGFSAIYPLHYYNGPLWLFPWSTSRKFSLNVALENSSIHYRAMRHRDSINKKPGWIIKQSFLQIQVKNYTQNVRNKNMCVHESKRNQENFASTWGWTLHEFNKSLHYNIISESWYDFTYPSEILAVLFKARHAVKAAKGMALASYKITMILKSETCT